jgi:DNA-binding transcriptional regulator LsrR (DeoR family)
MRELDDDRTRLLTQVASLYHEQGLTQGKVAQKVGLSRSNISRLLTEARQRGIVEIRIRQPLPTVAFLEAELKDRFQLRDAHVLSSGTRSTDMVLQGIGALAAEHLKDFLHDSMVLGIGWGTALYETVNAFRPMSVNHVQVVQMIGGIGAVNPHIDGTELARRLAEALGGRFRYLLAPLVVESAAVREALMQERDVREVLDLAHQADLAIVGIGSVHPKVSSLIRAGYLTENELRAIAQAGSVGDICAQHFDIHGHICQLELHQRIIGMDLASLRKVKCVFAVAGWKEKAPAILGALRGGFVEILVTNDVAAQEVLRLADATDD